MESPDESLSPTAHLVPRPGLLDGPRGASGVAALQDGRQTCSTAREKGKNCLVPRTVSGRERRWGNGRRKVGYAENLWVCIGRASPVLPRAARRRWSGKMETVKFMFPHPEGSSPAEPPVPGGPCIKHEASGHGCLLTQAWSKT